MVKKLEDVMQKESKFTALLYCAPGVGKSTAIGLIAEQSKGRTLVLDVDRTIVKTLAKKEVVSDLSKIDIEEVDLVETWDNWESIIQGLIEQKKNGTLDYENIAVDNISELERCILSDLGRKGKNKGVPAMADYQYMQFRMVNSLRTLKQLGVNVILTAWESTREFRLQDGSSYSILYPKCAEKIVDNICGLCDIVGKIMAKADGTRGIVLEATPNIYAKNQIDNRKGCLVEDFIKFNNK